MTDDSFDADWLSLREPVDHRSRSTALLAHLSEWWARRSGSRIVDLGAGAGSNLRYLAPRLGGTQDWVLVERDARLLGRAGGRAEKGAPDSVTPVLQDLTNRGLEPIAEADLVTASALLDLVSEDWLRRLVIACESTGAAVLLALSYDGSIRWGPPDSSSTPPDASSPPLEEGAPTPYSDPVDEPIRRAVNRHQRGDKGFGPALGSAATDVAEALLRVAGYATLRAPSPWRLRREDEGLALALIEGWETAAAEIRPDRLESFRKWGERRRGAVQTGLLRPCVGHLDLLAIPR